MLCTCVKISYSNGSCYCWIFLVLYMCSCNAYLLYMCHVCSYYLYTYDKMVAPNVSLRKEGEVSHEMLGALLKQHYGRKTLTQDGQYAHL